jgi:hypothetical protein
MTFSSGESGASLKSQSQLLRLVGWLLGCATLSTRRLVTPERRSDRRVMSSVLFGCFPIGRGVVGLCVLLLICGRGKGHVTVL